MTLAFVYESIYSSLPLVSLLDWLAKNVIYMCSSIIAHNTSKSGMIQGYL